MSTLVAQTISNGTVSTSSANVIQGSAKAWVSFNGSNGSMYGNFNVSSVTRNSQGDFTVNFTNAMPDINYAVNGSCSTAGSQVEIVLNINSQTSGAIVTPTTSATRLVVSKSGVGRQDPTYVTISINR